MLTECPSTANTGRNDPEHAVRGPGQPPWVTAAKLPARRQVREEVDGTWAAGAQWWSRTPNRWPCGSVNMATLRPSDIDVGGMTAVAPSCRDFSIVASRSGLSAYTVVYD